MCVRNGWPKGSVLLSKGIVWVLLCVCVYAHTTTNGILFYNIF